MAKERLTKMATVRFSEADWSEIVRVAEVEGMDAAKYIRGATLTVMALRGNRHALRVVGRGAWNWMSEILGRRGTESESSVITP